MQQNFTGYLVNTLSRQYESDTDYAIAQFMRTAKIERTPGKLPRFLNQHDRDCYDSLIESLRFSSAEWQDDNVETAIENFAKDNNSGDIGIIDAPKSAILSYADRLALEAFERGDDLSLKTIKKRLFKKQRFLQEAIALYAGVVRKYGMNRCTTWQLQNRKNKHINDAEWASKTVITNGTNAFTLASGGQTRVKKQNELYVIAKGIEKIAEADGMGWASVVCTVPPNMHSSPSNGNNSWDGTLPNESASWLEKQWKKVRSDLANDEIVLSGLWTREAHSDGTPHINFLIYFHKEHKHQVFETFKTYFSHSEKAMRWRDGGDAPAGKDKASFASYALKYFAKFLSADEMPSDECLSEEAWASAFSLRRYGFFGIPSLQQWHRLRAQRTEVGTSPLLQASWRAARRNDAAAWIGLNGGLGKKQKDRPIKIVTQLSVSGKSRIAIGVQEVETGFQIISKIVGEWTLKTLKTAVDAVKLIDEKTETKLVTLSLSYPSKNQNLFKTLAEFQKRRDILYPPPLIQ